MKVRCERDKTVFNAVIQSYQKDWKHKREDIPDKFIECPTCHRRYFESSHGDFVCDRKLTIL